MNNQKNETQEARPEDKKQKMPSIWPPLIVTLVCAALLWLRWAQPRFVDLFTVSMFVVAALAWFFLYLMNIPGGISLGFKNRLETICHELENADNAQQVASRFLKATLPFYEDVRLQARRSFASALLAALVGVGFFIYAAHEAMSSKGAHINISVVAGTLIQVIAGLNFVLYGNVSKQFFAFHTCLERIDRFMIANSLCADLGPAKKDEMRSELVKMIAGAPPLTFDLISGKTRHGAHKAQKSKPLAKSAAAGS